MADGLFDLHTKVGVVFRDLKFDWICHSNVDSGLTWIFDGLCIPVEETVGGGFYGGVP